MAKTDAPPRAAPRYAALGEAWRLLNPFAADGEGLQELAAMAMVSVARSVLTYFTATATSMNRHLMAHFQTMDGLWAVRSGSAPPPLFTATVLIVERGRKVWTISGNFQENLRKFCQS